MPRNWKNTISWRWSGDDLWKSSVLGILKHILKSVFLPQILQFSPSNFWKPRRFGAQIFELLAKTRLTLITYNKERSAEELAHNTSCQWWLKMMLIPPSLVMIDILYLIHHSHYHRLWRHYLDINSNYLVKLQKFMIQISTKKIDFQYNFCFSWEEYIKLSKIIVLKLSKNQIQSQSR